MILCPMCNGTGIGVTWFDDGDPCYYCKGNGQVVEPTIIAGEFTIVGETKQLSGGEKVKRVCNECGGTGLVKLVGSPVPWQGVCLSCRGQGVVECESKKSTEEKNDDSSSAPSPNGTSWLDHLDD